ncbi:cation/H(+) antiporter 11-like [Hevea brasiliensis]|uniref:cation/H(+) antiporter 11-like n=1 Tax=Hevea brasiliensis TaxID=3981 RepID=UPI0025D82B3D|nr:cation/H(+) antiporter 11-like [Hevea brasiliensis]
METSQSIVNVSGSCFDYVPVNSEGIWNLKHGESILQHSFVRFQIQLVAMVAISHSFHFFLKHLYFPRLTSDVLAGMILGPTFLERYFPNASKLLYPPVPNQVFASLLKIGLVLFTFLAAVRSDTSWITKIGKRGFILGALLVGFPNLMTLDLKVIYDPKVSLTPPQISARDNNALLYLSSFTKSQFVDVSAILMQLRITNSRLGHLALASTLLGDIARFVGSNLWYLSTRIFAPVSPRIGFQSAVLLIFFFMLIVFLRTLTLWFIRVTPEGEPIKDIYVHFIVVVVLYLASLGDNMGLEYLWGPFLFGLLIPARSPLATTLTSKLDTVVYGLLVPLLSGFCASKFNLWVLLDHFEDALNFQMALIGYIIKLVATYLMVLFINIPFREAAALTLILNVKGTKEMGTFLSYTTLELKDLDSTSGIFLIFLLTTYAPPIIKLLYDPTKHYIGYKKKCIQYTQCNAGLEILVCAHKQEDAMAAIKLLELSNPTKHSPLFIFVLCLQELVGSYTPLLINHQLGQKSSDSEASRSQPIIDVFKYFQSEHKRSALVNIFTAVSPLRQLHEDICRLAFDNNCSLILLPFHKKWNENGTLVANSNDLRKLNNDVLERAPCSVGILIDHRKTRGLSPIFDSSTVHHVAVLFIGGSDDREALAYALRMAKSPEVQLTVMCFVTPQEFVHDSWEIMLDSESLTSLKEEMSENSNISYVEETVRDGSDTAAIVSSIQGNFDLIMVGRRHTHQPEAISGLSQWAELPELGPVGDILASPDISSTCSVLVMQQQILKVDHSSILN